MPLQYPSNRPYNPYQQVGKPKNWPLIILITLGVVIVVGVVVYFIVNNPFSNADDGNPVNNTIAVGEPNPNGYDCSADVYNCANFTNQGEAHVAFNYCKDQGAGDIWNLDGDNDGEVCESYDFGQEGL